LETSFHGGSTVAAPANWLPPILESKEEERSTYHDTGSEDMNPDPNTNTNTTINTELILSWLEKNNPVNGSTTSSSTIKFGDAPMQQINILEPPKPNRIANDTFFLAVARSCSLMLRSKMFQS